MFAARRCGSVLLKQQQQYKQIVQVQRNVISKVGFGTQASGESSSAGKTLPSVTDSMVSVTFIDYRGKRTTLKGMVGMTLPEVCLYNNCDVLQNDGSGNTGPYSRMRSPRWEEDIFGAGASSRHTHVIISNEYYDKIPGPMQDEKDLLSQLEFLERGPITPHSRLGSEIKLSKELDGMEVHVPDPYPQDIP